MNTSHRCSVTLGEIASSSTSSDSEDRRTALSRHWSRTIFGKLEHVLHRTAISRIALLPTVHASSVQSIEESTGSISSRTLRENGDEDGAVAIVTDDADSETGWDRLKDSFFMNKVDGLSRELYEVIMMFVLGGMLGFVYGGFPASRHAKNRYIQQSQASLYHSKLEATGSSYNAASRGMIRYGYRWGWRTALIAGGYHGISTYLAVYRNKQDLLCYTVAGVTTGVLYRINLGLRGMVGGAVVGALLGIPCGAVLLGFHRIKGETSIEKCRRERAERRMEKAEELALRMQMTPQMMQLMEESMQKSDQLVEEKKRVELASSSSSLSSS